MPKKMDLLKKLRQPLILNAIKSMGDNFETKNPLIVELDPTQACDLACPSCISEDMVSINKRLSSKRLLDLAYEFYNNKVKGVILIGGGEPLLHPAIGDFIKYSGEHDIHIGITTNGTMIDRYLEIISQHASWTRISVDASTSKTYNILRPAKAGKSKFKRVIKNIELLSKNKKGKLGYSFLLQTPADGHSVVSNIHEIYDAALLAREIGCDYFEVKPSYQFRKGVDHSLMVHENHFMEEAKYEISRLDELVTKDFSVMKAINLDFSLLGAESKQIKTYAECPAAELRTLICPSGVYVCPYWRGKDHMLIGDINNQSLKSLWSSDLRKQVMKKLNPRIHCNFHCLRHESNLEIIKLRRDIKSKKIIKKIIDYDRFI